MATWRRVDAGLIRLHARKYMPAPVHPHPQTHATHPPARSRSPTPTHTQKYVRLFDYPRQLQFRKRISMLRYTCIASLVKSRLVIIHASSVGYENTKFLN